MTLQIIKYGNYILRKECVNITLDYPDLPYIIDNMWITMFFNKGAGLAAPQVNLSIRLFIVDSLKKVFINPTIINESEETCSMIEGCLSIPGIKESVIRPVSIEMEYFDEDFIKHTEVFTGDDARVIQHEYDHIEGILFIDYLSPLKKKLIQGKLTSIKNTKSKLTNGTINK